MAERLKKILPWLAVFCGAIALGCLLVAFYLRPEMLADTGETRLAVQATLDELESSHPTTLDDPLFRAAVGKAAQAPYVVTLWLFAPDGRVVWAEGSTAASFPHGSVEERATDEMLRVLATMPENTFNDEQRTLLLAASAIQAEGEHNDIYRHLVRVIRSPEGAAVALVGVAYDVSAKIDTPGAGWIALVLAIALGGGCYWLALPVWVYLDAKERGERAWVWAVFVLLGNLVALVAFILARLPPREIEAEVPSAP